jgi:hypothetical protein
LRMWLPPEKAAGYPDVTGPALPNLMKLRISDLSSILLAHNQSQLSLPDSDYCKNLLQKQLFP